METHDYWYCSSCNEMRKNKHKGNHFRSQQQITSGSRYIIIDNCDLPELTFHVSEDQSLLTEGSNQSSTFNPYTNNENIFLQIDQSGVRTIKRINARLRLKITKQYNDLLVDVIQDPSNIDKFARLYVYPQCVLGIIQHANPKYSNLKQNQYTKMLVRMWDESDVERNNMLQDVLQAKLRISSYYTTKNLEGEDLQNHNRKSCLKLAYINRLSDAMKALVSHGTKFIDNNVFTLLQEKHPIRSENIILEENQHLAFISTSEQVRNAILSFKTESACGTDGLRADHLKSFLRETQIPFLNSLTELVNIMAAGKLPKLLAKHIASAPLTVLSKKDNGIRPIAVGETLRRIVSKLAFKESLKYVLPYLSPFQVGVGKKRAIEHAVFDLQEYINGNGNNSEKVVLMLDFANAFNIINRQVFMEQTRLICPSISSWVEYCYIEETNLYANERIIKSSVGTQQGDPLAGVLFCLALQKLVLKIKEKFPDFDYMKWYMDDGIIAGDINTIRDIYNLIEQESHALGLKLQVDKSCLFSSASDEILAVFPQSMKRIRQSGFPALGAPIGDVSFISSFAVKLVAKSALLLSEISELDNPQVELNLIRTCGGLPKINHLLRVCDPKNITDAINLFDELLDKSLSGILNRQINYYTRMEISQPLRFGGLGIPSANYICRQAYIGARISYLKDRGLSESSEAEAETLISMVNNSIDDSLKFSTQDILASIKPQKFLTEIIHENSKIVLLASASDLDRKRLTSIHSQTTYWGNISAKNHLEPCAFRSYLRYYLGLQTLPDNGTCSQCGRYQDCRGIHDSRCSNHLSIIHNALRDSLCQIMSEAKFNVRKEERNLLNNGTEERPADILWLNSPNGRDQCLDVSVVGYNINDGIATREAEKIKKYEFQCRLQFLGFTPLLVNSLGKFSEKFMETLNIIARELADTSGMSIGQARYYVRSKTQFALISAIGKALSSKLKAFGH